MAIQHSFGGGLRELALFAGAGGGILGGKLLGWRTVCAVEVDPYAAAVLAARQNDGSLDPFPIWDNIQTFDGRPWRGIVDVVSGGFPCQDISLAGRGEGIDGARSGLWSEMARIIGEVRPRHAFVENSPAIITRGLGRILSDLAALGYDCRWTVLGAADVGAPHKRDRFWLVATDADSEQLRELPRRCGRAGRTEESPELEHDGSNGLVANTHRELELQQTAGRQEVRDRIGDCGEAMAHTDGQRLENRQGESSDARQELTSVERTGWWSTEPDVGRVANGVPSRVDRLKAIGNGQVPEVARAAWEFLIS